MRRLLVALLILLPSALAQPGGALDARISLAPDAAPVVDAPPGLVTVGNVTPGERVELRLALERPHTTLEVQAAGFDLARPRQLVPSLDLPGTEYPLFHAFPHERVWEVDSPANVFFTQGTPDRVVLRLGIAGPRNVTLVLARDVAPPTFRIKEMRDLTHLSFYQETTTEELAYADLQVRAVGTQEWVRNPTPQLHVLQRFPVQGLSPERDYEARVVFTDWAGNEATSEVYRFRTPAPPVGPVVTITPLAPAPNATLAPGVVTLRARVESPGTVGRDGVRLFFDLKEVSDRVRFEGGEVSFTPDAPLSPGVHRVLVEATNEERGAGVAKWSFTIEEGSKAPGFAPVALAVGVGIALLGGRSGRRT